MLVLIDDSYFESENVAVVRPVDDDEDQTIIFMVGADPVAGGFLVDEPIEDVVRLLNNATISVLAQSLDDARQQSSIDGDHPPSIDDDAVVDLGT